MTPVLALERALSVMAMVDSGVDIFVAFSGGRGTADCVRRCLKAGAVPFERNPLDLYGVKDRIE